MNAIQLITKINTRIEDLAMYSAELLKPNTNLGEIEKEVLKKNCAELYELILRLKTTSDLSEEQIHVKESITQEIKHAELNFKDIVNQESSEELSINNIAEVAETILQANEATEIAIPEPETMVIAAEVVVVEEQTPIAESIAEIPTIAEEPTILPEPEKVVEVVEEAEKVEKQAEPQVTIVPIPEMFKDMTTPEVKEKPAPFFSIGKTVMPATEASLNEKIAMNKDGFQHAEKIIEPKIDSLKTAISLNKKIAFVNELFKENVVEYAKSIDKINNSNDLNEAMLTWTELKIAHNWSHDNALVKDLEKLIQRRFS